MTCFLPEQNRADEKAATAGKPVVGVGMQMERSRHSGAPRTAGLGIRVAKSRDPTRRDTRGDRTAHQRRGKERSDAMGRERSRCGTGREWPPRRRSSATGRRTPPDLRASNVRKLLSIARTWPFRSRAELRKLKLAHYRQVELVLRQAAAWIEDRDALGLTFAPIPQHEIGVFVGRAAHATGGEQARRSRRDQVDWRVAMRRGFCPRRLRQTRDRPFLLRRGRPLLARPAGAGRRRPGSRLRRCRARTARTCAQQALALASLIAVIGSSAR